MNNLPKALEYSKRYAELLDTIYQKELSSKIIELQHKYDYSLIQSENKLLKIKRQRLYISLIAICMAVLTVAVIFFYKRREEKRKLAEQMRSKDDLMKEMRLQLQEKTIDLHAAQEKIIEKETALDKELSQREKMRSEYSSKEAAMRKEILRHSEIIRKMEQLNKMSQQDKIQSRSVVLSDEEQDNLAEVINICYNNFTDRLWKKFPTLTKADISLCCLIKIGISNSNMLYLLDTSKVALKKRKTASNTTRWVWTKTIRWMSLSWNSDKHYAHSFTHTCSISTTYILWNPPCPSPYQRLTSEASINCSGFIISAYSFLHSSTIRACS